MREPISLKREIGKKESILTISNEREIGKGYYGKVYQVDVTVQVGNSKRTAPFVLKRYFDNETSAATNAESAAKNYQVAKEAGLKVFKTFRHIPEDHSILMSTAHTETEVCVGSNKGSNRVSDFKELGIEKVPTVVDFNEFLYSLFKQANIAAEHGVRLDADSLFFLLRKDNPTKVDFVIGDYDMVVKVKKYDELELHNLQELCDAVEIFIMDNVEDESKDKMIKTMNELYASRVKELKESTLARNND